MDADGRSGGLLSLWNLCVFKKELEVKNQNFILLKGKVIGEGVDLIIVNIYGSTLKTNRRRMWEELLEAKNMINGHWIMLGDFNEVRFPEERFNSQFDASAAMCFNSFISRGGFQEYNMGGMRFTFLAGDGSNLSKIDRVLVCNNFMDKWPNASLLALNRKITDHSPLILSTVNNSFGPSPFRLFNSWFTLDGFDEAVKRGLNKICDSRFKDEVVAVKLKAIKDELKIWRKNNKDEEERDLTEAQNKITQLDDLAETRLLSDSEIMIWQDCKEKVKKWHDKVAADLCQKAKSRWIGLGDENTSYFHTIMNSHIARNKINGLWIDGAWVSDPNEIKTQFLAAFQAKFKEPINVRPRIGAAGFKRLSQEQAEGLITPFSILEVGNAVWECGINKSPGPDGITFKLIKAY
ncbi:putative RNA-directed DNA polymerase [Helianthus annuus]|uniref:uncharacterized protein LOC110869617 n=1 Tax=Helianthus annuus TaxID=4232 RepID=UPI000B8F3809|nr:uncharacterized protein LOC110869617 [Helianthus annuus]KAJ0545596.1 putative RNA-directed DNA polymerase [Helianthus annuus]